jgi:hypothetical protein
MITWDEYKFVQNQPGKPLHGIDWAIVRVYRNQRLQESDIMITRFAEAGLPVSDAWKTYREQLRNITDAFVDPEQVVFPDAPPFVIPDTAVSQEERLEAAELMIDLLLDTQQETP